MSYILQTHPSFCFILGKGGHPAHPILCPPLQPAEERSPDVPILGPSHPWVLPQAHLICQQCGHGPANLVVGFHFGGAQQDEEEPVARQDISRAALSPQGMFLQGETMQMWGWWLGRPGGILPP